MDPGGYLWILEVIWWILEVIWWILEVIWWILEVIWTGVGSRDAYASKKMISNKMAMMMAFWKSSWY